MWTYRAIDGTAVRAKTACDRGAPCVEGACETAAPFVSLAGTASVVEVSAGSPEEECLWYNEAYPERSAYPGESELPAEFFAGHNRERGPWNYNWGYAWNLWGLGATVPAPAEYSFVGDPWAATSGETELDYISFLATNGSARQTAIAGGHPDYIDNGVWDFSAIVDSGVSDSDGPAVHFDSGGQQLWVVDAGGSTVRLYSFAPCTGGAPGTAGCPLRAGPILVQSGGRFGHPNVLTNPCTHNAIVAYRTVPYNGFHDIVLSFYDSYGALISQKQVAFQLRWDRNNNCGGTGENCSDGFNPHPGYICKCGGPESTDCRGLDDDPETPDWDCMRWFPRVHLSARAVGEEDCRLAIGYDDTNYAQDGYSYFKSHYQIYGVTDETAIVQRYTADSSPWYEPYNEFGGLVSFNEFTASFGFFFYRQRDNNACDTVFVARADSGYGESPPTFVGNTFGFPTFSWMGDYIGIVRRGLPSGYLFATWAEPEPTEGGYPCPACLGKRWSNRIRGVRVHP